MMNSQISKSPKCNIFKMKSATWTGDTSCNVFRNGSRIWPNALLWWYWASWKALKSSLLDNCSSASGSGLMLLWMKLIVEVSSILLLELNRVSGAMMSSSLSSAALPTGAAPLPFDGAMPRGCAAGEHPPPPAPATGASTALDAVARVRGA